MENEPSQSSVVKEAVMHAEEVDVITPATQDESVIEQQPPHAQTADIVAEASSQPVFMETEATASTSRRGSLLQSQGNAAEASTEAEMATAVPVEAHAVGVPLAAHDAAPPAPRDAELHETPSPVEQSDSPSAPIRAITTTSTVDSTPALPSPVPHLSVGATASLSQMSPGLDALAQDAPAVTVTATATSAAAGKEQPQPETANVGVPVHATHQAQFEAAYEQQQQQQAEAEMQGGKEGRHVSMHEAVQRSMEVYADARPNTNAYWMDENGTGREFASSIPGARAGSRAGSFVQTTTGVGVLTDFQRGSDNSHTNRMVDGSYSRYLEATRNVPEPEVYPTFYGAQPLAGTAPVSLMATQDAMEEARMSQRFRVTHPGLSAQATLDGGFASSTSRRTGGLDQTWSARSRGLPHAGIYNSQPHSASRTAEEVAEWGETDNRDFTGINRKQRTVGGMATASVLRRELDLLEPELNQELAEQRSLRRRAPQHCKPVRQERDFVYYNHRSKGFYVPHDMPPDTIMMNYNHTFDFGIGTRFLTGERPARRNPGAQAPLLYSEMTRGSRRWQTRTHPSLYGVTSCSAGGAVGHEEFAATAGGETIKASTRHKSREQIATQSHSLRTAHAISTDDLHTSQFRRTRTIEDVMAQSPAYMPPNTVSGIQDAVATGKVTPQEIPSQLRTAVDVAATRYGLNDAGQGPSSCPPSRSKLQSGGGGGAHLHSGRGRLRDSRQNRSPSPGTSARTAAPGTRFTEKPEKSLLGVMGTAASTPPRAGADRGADLSALASQKQQRLNQPARAESEALPPVAAAASAPHNAYSISRLHK